MKKVCKGTAGNKIKYQQISRGKKRERIFNGNKIIMIQSQREGKGIYRERVGARGINGLSCQLDP